MDDAWRTRLAQAIADRNLSKRGVSLAAEQGAGYVHSILSEGKDPSVVNLEAVCRAVGVSLQYILYGYDISPETERLLRLMEANPESRDGILKILEAQETR